VDDLRLGRSVRVLRRHRGWRQTDLAAAAGSSQAAISRLERGEGGGLSLAALRRLATALGARLDVRLDWQGGGLDRLLDRAHADLVERVVRTLRPQGWELVPEASFSVYGERGSIDVLALHPASGVLLVVEVKSVLQDVQGTLMVLDRKVRLADRISRDRGWRPRSVARLLVLGARGTNRHRVAEHREIFQVAFPERGTVVKRWLRRPAGRISGLLFISDNRQTAAGRPRARPVKGIRIGPPRSHA
jgi:transcriptional regulator with XRE-family HTH domain